MKKEVAQRKVGQRATAILDTLDYKIINICINAVKINGEIGESLEKIKEETGLAPFNLKTHLRKLVSAEILFMVRIKGVARFVYFENIPELGMDIGKPKSKTFYEKISSLVKSIVSEDWLGELDKSTK